MPTEGHRGAGEVSVRLSKNWTLIHLSITFATVRF